MFSKPSLLVLLHLTFSLAAQIFKRTPDFQGLARRTTIEPAATKDGEPILQHITIPLNHFGINSGTFENRYWVDDLYYEPGGPVLFYDVGEQPGDIWPLENRQGGVGSLAAEFNGLVITWEHRFYGSSMPNMTDDMEFTPDKIAEYLRYHTIEQALEDVAFFARQFSFSGLAEQDLRPGNTPWVFIGGSYPGARSAWARSRNPEVFHAAVASSAIVQLRAENPAYYHVIEDFMDNYGYANCSADVRAMAQYVDDAHYRGDLSALDSLVRNITGPKGSDVYRYFGYREDEEAVSPEEVMRTLKKALDLFLNDFQIYGINGILGIFCESLQQNANPPQNILGSLGVFAEQSESTAVQLYASTLREWWEFRLQHDPKVSIPSPNSTVNDPHCGGVDRDYCMAQMSSVSWYWQVCLELATAEKSRPQNLLPYALWSSDQQLINCIASFGPTVQDGPNFTPLVERYGGWLMNPSNILWVDGEFDPWRTVTLDSIEEVAPKRAKTKVIPKSGETPGGDTFFGIVVKGGLHVPDFGPTWNTTGSEAHELFMNALHEWLPAFMKHEVGSGIVARGLPEEVYQGVSSRISAGIEGVALAVVAAVILSVL